MGTWNFIRYHAFTAYNVYVNVIEEGRTSNVHLPSDITRLFGMC